MAPELLADQAWSRGGARTSGSPPRVRGSGIEAKHGADVQEAVQNFVGNEAGQIVDAANDLIDKLRGVEPEDGPTAEPAQ